MAKVSIESPKKKSVYEIVTERVIEQMKSGNIMWRKSWKGNAPCNYVSGHKYTGINFMLLNSVGTTPYWLTENNIKKVGGDFKPGEKEKPQIIVFWNFVEKEVENKRTGKIENKKIPFLRYFRVYNQDQCIDIPEKKIIALTKHDPIEKCEEVIAKTGAKITYYSGDKAYYSPSNDDIWVPDKKYFDKINNFYSVSFHELTHWTGAKQRLDREGIVRETFDETDPKNAYSFEELVAEFGAAFLCAEMGVDNDFTVENSAAYISNWVGKLEENQKWLVRAAGRAQKAADFILKFSKPEQTDGEHDDGEEL